jgi:hypothetical protein
METIVLWGMTSCSPIDVKRCLRNVQELAACGADGIDKCTTLHGIIALNVICVFPSLTGSSVSERGHKGTIVRLRMGTEADERRLFPKLSSVHFSTLVRFHSFLL